MPRAKKPTPKPASKQASAADHKAELERRREIVDGIIHDVDWDGDIGYAPCPGVGLHSNRKTGPTDLMVVLSGAGNAWCFHDSCHTVVHPLAETLREKFRENAIVELECDEESKKREAYGLALSRVEGRARTIVLRKLLDLPPKPLDEWSAISPCPIPENVEEHAHLFVRSLFGNDDVLWMGQPHDSGQPQHLANFKTASEWLTRPALEGPFIGFTTFKPGIYHRGVDTIAARPYFVVESDSISKEQFGRIVEHVIESGFLLRALIDTGGKSLHAWFDVYNRPIKDYESELLKHPDWPRGWDDYRKLPIDEFMRVRSNLNRLWSDAVQSRKRDVANLKRERDERVAYLRGLGCDPKMLKSVLISRLPGVQRLNEDGSFRGWQRLHYLRPRESHLAFSLTPL